MTPCGPSAVSVTESPLLIPDVTSSSIEPSPAGVYRESRALLATLPAYGRAFLIHALAARALRGEDATAAAEASRLAKQAQATLRGRTPAAQLEALARLARTSGLDVESPP